MKRKQAKCKKENIKHKTKPHITEQKQVRWVAINLNFINHCHHFPSPFAASLSSRAKVFVWAFHSSHLKWSRASRAAVGKSCLKLVTYLVYLLFFSTLDASILLWVTGSTLKTYLVEFIKFLFKYSVLLMWMSLIVFAWWLSTPSLVPMLWKYTGSFLCKWRLSFCSLIVSDFIFFIASKSSVRGIFLSILNSADLL